MPRVTQIPATIHRYTATPIAKKTKRKVAGYARVSTGNEDQATSYEAQVDYYTQYIRGRDDWQFAGIYTDDGISGTSTKHRKGFQKMIADAMNGKIDLILTKSVSRFARNTVDSLEMIRQLKEHGVEVYFEKENIWTFDAKGELLITIMSSIAQEESRSISENVRWGKRKQFADGKVTVSYSQFLGYDKGPDGKMVINPEQAKTVRQIYKWFLEGYSYAAIAKRLMTEGYLTASGRTHWHTATVSNILQNEKYKGDALLQKTFIADYLTKKTVKNEGQMPQYYVENDHEAIIPRETFDLVQAEIARRKMLRRYNGTSLYADKIKCGDCGSSYGAKVWHSNDKYRRTIYQCNHKFQNHCKTPHLTEQEVQSIFVQAFNRLLDDKNEILENLTLVQQQLFDTRPLEEKQCALAQEMQNIVDTIQARVEENARTVQDQQTYEEWYQQMVENYDKAKSAYTQLETSIKQRQLKSRTLKLFQEALSQKDGALDSFDKELWSITVASITVYQDAHCKVSFKNGDEIILSKY